MFQTSHNYINTGYLYLPDTKHHFVFHTPLLTFGSRELSRSLPFLPHLLPLSWKVTLSSPPCGSRNSHGRADQFKPVRYQSVPGKRTALPGGVPGAGEGDKSTGGRAGWLRLDAAPAAPFPAGIRGDGGEERLEAPGRGWIGFGRSPEPRLLGPRAACGARS